MGAFLLEQAEFIPTYILLILMIFFFWLKKKPSQHGPSLNNDYIEMAYALKKKRSFKVMKCSLSSHVLHF